VDGGIGQSLVEYRDFSKEIMWFWSLKGWSFGGCGLLKQMILVVIGCGSLPEFLFRF